MTPTTRKLRVKEMGGWGDGEKDNLQVAGFAFGVKAPNSQPETLFEKFEVSNRIDDKIRYFLQFLSRRDPSFEDSNG